MRIAYVVSAYPYPSHTFIADEVRGLRELGVEVDTFSIRRAAPAEVLSDADHEEQRRTYAIRPPRLTHFALAHLRALLGSPRAYLDTLGHAVGMAGPGVRSRVWQLMYFVQAVVLWDRCRRRGIRHLHAHFANVASDVALLAARLARTWTWSFTMHGPTEFYEVSGHRLAEKTAEAALVVCISDFCRSQLMGLAGPEHWGKLHVIHCGVDIDRFKPAETRGGDGVPHIVDVGRLVPVKGQAVMLEAAASLRDLGHDFQLTLLGGGPDMDALRDQAAQLSLGDRVQFLGAVAHERVRELLGSADLLCLPSFAEGVPVSLMEAMAMEVPVVASRIMGIPELLEDGRCGALVAPGDATELTAQLDRLLGDPQARSELGRLGRERIARDFDRAACTRSLCALLQNAAAAAEATTRDPALRP